MKLITIKDFYDKKNNELLRSSKNENSKFEETDLKRARFLIDEGYCLEIVEETKKQKIVYKGD